MKNYRLKYLFTIIAFLLVSIVGYGQSEAPISGDLTITVEPILSFEVNNLNIDFIYDEFGNEDNDIFDKNTFRVTGNVDWEFSIYSQSSMLTCPESSDEVPVSMIEIFKNDLSVDNGVIITADHTIVLSTSPQVVLAGQGSIPTSDIRLRWHFMDMNSLGNIRAGFYTTPVVYQITSNDIP